MELCALYAMTMLYWGCRFHVLCLLCSCCFFFFQAEDGIRDLTVTGVQTCALPISVRRRGVVAVSRFVAADRPGRPWLARGEPGAALWAGIPERIQSAPDTASRRTGHASLLMPVRHKRPVFGHCSLLESAASAGYNAISLRITPLVQPNPSCSGYSPPPPLRPALITSYFSTSLPVSPYTRLTLTIQRQAMVSARRPCAYWRRPETAIHCSGAQPLGASHCSPVFCVVVTMPPSSRSCLPMVAATESACSREAAFTNSGYKVAAEIRGTRIRSVQ